MTLRSMALSVFAAGLVVSLAFGIDAVERQTRHNKSEVAAARAALHTCAGQLQAAQAHADRLQGLLDGADYFLWEVHDVSGINHDPRDARQDGDLPALCEALGDHSVLHANGELAGYSLWVDKAGRQKLGCRYVRRKEP